MKKVALNMILEMASFPKKNNVIFEKKSAIIEIKYVSHSTKILLAWETNAFDIKYTLQCRPDTNYQISWNV